MMNKRSDALRWGLLMSMLVSGSTAISADWLSAGRDLKNSRYQADEKKISAKTVAGLTLKWSVATDGDVTANPAVDGDFLYFPDSAGYLYKVDRNTGAIIWKHRVSTYTGISGDFARATPAVAGNALILGNQSGKFLGAYFGQPDPQPAQVFAVDKNTGALIWKTQVDSTPLSFVTHSAIVSDGTAFVGTASNEELVSAFVPPPYWTWQFRGSVVALDVATGAVKWKTYTVPEGYAGGAVWGSTGAIDRARNHVYMATGNNYWVPPAAQSCLQGGGSPASCLDPANMFDSIIALDLTTGAVKWSARGLPYDGWSVACGLDAPGFVVPPNGNCPIPQGPDWDFAQGPLLFADTGANADTGLVGAGQKSGMFWAFRAKDGKPAWSRQVTPGGVTGGLQWGSASDGRSIYVAAANAGPSTNGGGRGAQPWTLKDGSTTKAGGWAALDAKTGAVQWTTADPGGWVNNPNFGSPNRAEAAVGLANGVMFGCNLAGKMYGLDAKTGAVLWSYDSGAPCNAGPSIADGVVYWGSGTFFGNGAKKVFAFGL